MNMPPSTYDLIHEYLSAANSSIAALSQIFEVDNLLSARRDGSIPAKGIVDGGMTFSFHGIGCEVTTNQYKVDFDFTEAGQCAGFDAWRLWIFLQSRVDRYPELRDQQALGTELARLERLGFIQKNARTPHVGMYRLG